MRLSVLLIGLLGFALGRAHAFPLRRDLQRGVGALQSRGDLSLGQVDLKRAVQVKGGAAPSSPNRSPQCAALRAVISTTFQVGALLGSLKLTLVAIDRLKLSEDAASVVRLLSWFLVVFCSGFFASLPSKWSKLQILQLERTLENDWYESLKKPSWQPPNWLFPIMWFPVKMFQVFAGAIVWREMETPKVLVPSIAAYLVYKALGDTWNKVWFESGRLGLGVSVFTLYYAVLLATCALFSQIRYPSLAVPFIPFAFMRPTHSAPLASSRSNTVTQRSTLCFRGLDG
ncbi:unnamed protein product [Chrysoparadoxa australica]